MMNSAQTESVPPGWFWALAGGVSGGASALLFPSSHLLVGVGTGAGMLLWYLGWRGWQAVRTRSADSPS